MVAEHHMCGKPMRCQKEIGAKACGTLNMTTDELNGKMMTYLIKALELAMKEHNFDMIDEAESLIKEYRELHDRFRQMLERTVETNDDGSNIEPIE